jgi:WD40 repeat protein
VLIVRTRLSEVDRPADEHPWNAAQAKHGHTGDVLAIAAGSAAGRPVFASGGDDGTIRLWDAATTDFVRSIEAHEAPVRAVVFTGDLVISAGEDGRVERWDPVTGERLGPALLDADLPVVALAAARLGERWLVAAAGEDERVRVWDAVTAAPHAELDVRREARSLALAASGDRLVALVIGALRDDEQHGDDLAVGAAWDVATGAELRKPMLIPDEGDVGAAGVVDGRPVVVHGIDAEKNRPDGWCRPEERADMTVRDLVTGELIATLSQPGYGWNRAVTLLTARSGRTLAFSAGDSRVIAWDPATGTEIARPHLHEFYTGEVSGLAVTELGDQIAVAACVDDQVCIWPVKNLLQAREPRP